MTLFHSPVGNLEERASGRIWPGKWTDANPFLNYYAFGYHEAADLNLNSPHFDADKHADVYAIGPGTVIYAQRWPNPNSWGRIIVIDHGIVDGRPCYSRYAHVSDIKIRVGDRVDHTTQIAIVGNGEGLFPYHLHFGICITNVLRSNAGHWPGENRQAVIDNYVAPKPWLEQEHTIGDVPMPDPITLYVQPPGGLRLRSAPNGTILRNSIPQNTQVNGFDTKQIGNILWQQVTFTLSGDALPFAGWMGARKGTEIYLAPTPVGPPPIPTGPTPYDGKNALWFWHPSASSITALLNTLPDSVGAIIVKTSDGARWHGEASGATAIDVKGIEDVDKWVRTAAVGGIDFHAWAVLQGEDVDGESQRLIDVCRVEGVKSLILDIEPYAQFWSGPRENIKAIMTRVRANIPTGFHIGLSIDPRSQHYASIFPDEWKPFVDSVHPQCYWATFEQPPADVLRSAYNTWSGFGKPIIPVLQGNADPSDIELAIDTALEVYKAQGLSFWRYGVMSAEQLAAIGDVAEPPVPEPVETLETTAKLNVRSKPRTDSPVLHVLDKGIIVKAQGHYKGAGANDWARLPDEPMESYAARDFMRTPVIVVPPAPKEDMFVWATPYMNIRKEPDVQATDVGDLAYGTKVAIEEIGVMADGYKWGKIGDGRFVAIEATDGDPKLLDFKAPPVIDVVPGLDEWSLDFHKHEGIQRGTDGNATNQLLLRMAEEGILTGVHIINDFGMANALADRGVDVLFRMQFGINDNIGHIAGNSSDLELGKRLWRDSPNQHAHANLHPSVVIQPQGTCEGNLGRDGNLFKGYAMAAADQGRRIGAYTDSFGAPANLNMVNGKFVANDVWKDRIDSGCQAWLAAHGDRAVYNAYSRARNLINPANGQVVGFKETDDYCCEEWPDGSRDDLAFRWYPGQRDFIWEEVMPEDCRPQIDLGECGSSAARIATLGGRKSPDGNIDLPGPGGLAAITWDLGGLQRRFGRSKWTRRRYYWTIGGDGGGDLPKGLYGFAYSSFDNLLPGIYQWAKVERMKYAVKRAA